MLMFFLVSSESLASIRTTLLDKMAFLEPRTRVALSVQNGVPTSDYINANYIRVRYSE